MRKLFLFLLLAALVPLSRAEAQAQAAPQTTLRIANYNVENLYDAVTNQPVVPLTGEPGDIDFTPQSWRRWTEERYRTKLDHLAWVLGQMKPDICVLEEVENRGVVKALVDRAKEAYGWEMPYIVHQDTDDPRGIDVAIISRFPAKKLGYAGHRGRRGILMAEITVDDTKVYVFGNHWKSQLGDAAQNIATRTGEALQLRELMLRRLSKDPDATCVACGDFNENLDGPAILSGLRPANDRKTALDSLAEDVQEWCPFNVIGDIPPVKRGSFFYARHKIWNTFDGIVVSPAMLRPAEEKGPAWRVGAPEETITFHTKEMEFGAEKRPNSYKRVRAEGASEYYTNGYSDHFPVLTVLHRAP